jgi:translation elongation factor P/translation initiation factor 5A
MMRKTKTILILAVFALAFLAHLYAADTQCIWTGIEKIVAVGDIHGDYDAFKTILQGTGLIDKKLHWTGGKTHLVQIGDVLDRGEYAKEIFDLMMKLEKEAKEAGGKLHMLIGNHEELNITGLIFNREEFNVRQLVSFLPDGYRERQVKRFRKILGDNPTKKTGMDSSLDSDLMPYWENLFNEVKASRRHPARREYLNNFNKKYGKWILKQNAVIKINNIIFVHGGISEKFSKWELKKINNRLRVELEDLRRAAMNLTRPKIQDYQRQIVYAPDGPYWYRDFATKDQDDFKENVDIILKNLEAEYMVIAHTPKIIKTKEDMQLFQGRIWIIDTGISKVYRDYLEGRLSALIIDKGKFDVWGLNNEKQESLDHYNFYLLFLWHFGSIKITSSYSGKYKAKRTGELLKNR